MGSLPNLHELAKNPHYRPTPTPNLPPLTSAEKSRYLHHVRIKKARSNGHADDANKIVFDDFMLAHMAAYSPISSSTTSRHHHTIRRRDSLSSSIGATSMRRLLGNVWPHPLPRPVRPQSRRLLLANLLALCLAHLAASAAFLPFLSLQASVAIWTLPAATFTPLHVQLGSLLLALVHLIGALSALLGPALVHHLGANCVLLVAYSMLALFYFAHLYPVCWLLVIVSIGLGMVMGPFYASQVEFLMMLATKVAFLFGENDDDAKALRKTCIIRRVARAFRAAHDFGLILGSVLSAVLVTYTISWSNRETYASNGGFNQSGMNGTGQPFCGNSSQENCTWLSGGGPAFLYDYNAFLDEIFDRFEEQRLCGAQACPPSFQLTFNESTMPQHQQPFHILPMRTTTVLAVVYGGLTLLAALITAIGLDQIRSFFYNEPMDKGGGMAAVRGVRESFRDVRLQMAAPLAVFIGMEQAFIYADFSKSYVVCTLGIHRLNLVFLSMGLLQSIAACTLSMLLRTIRRYYVVAVGFTFHACLLMVLILWKPIEDDPALFYVISAAWGVCNAIWEMLNFTLLTGLYSDSWEAAFAHSTCFRLLGTSVAFLFHGYLCNYWKLYALGVFLVAAVVPFAWLEVRLENMRKVKNIIRL